MEGKLLSHISYTIVGAGAIGGTLAHHLARAGHQVTVVDADAEHVAAIRADGITVERTGKRTSQPVARAITPTESGNEPIGRVLLAVKAHATQQALDWVEPRLTHEGFVVSLQNGLNEQTIADRIGSTRTVGAFVNLFADVISPGVIRDGGLGALVVGETDGNRSARVDEVVTDLQAWGLAKATTNVAGYLWSKLGFGAMLTATALADAPMAELIDRHRDVMHQLTGEIFTLASRLNITLEPFDAFDPTPYAGTDEQAKNAATDALVAWLRTQAKDRSGIWRDLAVRKRPTEVSTHYRPVLTAAAEAEVNLPTVADLVDQIQDLENGAAMSEDRLRDLRAVRR